MLDTQTNRLLMSDSLKGMVPDLEDDASQIASQLVNSFIITAIELHGFEPLVGSLAGISYDEKIIKLDVKLKLEQAYDVFTDLAMGKTITCEAIQMHLSERMNRIVGPFKLELPKMFGIDAQDRMCVLAVDLIKI